MKKPIPFGKYYLLDRISVGGMAEVFKAKAFGVEGFERLIAVKRILPSIAEDEEFITMFIDEAKIAVQLQHANIAQIFDLGKVGDSYFIALEYVSGKDVRTIFDRLRRIGQAIPIPMVAYVSMKVCEGLDYAHNKKDAASRDLNLVHRDVSPQNMLISYDGEIKLIDFGIAKAAGKAGKTQAGILKGKFGYMSPEQVRGLPLDRRSDIFAVGICMWEMITGERLFIGESDFSTLEKVRNVEIKPPSAYNSRIPEELENVILKTLSKEVEDRYQTAMDLHDDLQRWMYTSGNFFARKDLASFQHKLFKEDMEKEAQVNEIGIDIAGSEMPPSPQGIVRPGSSRAPAVRPGAPPLPPRRSPTASQLPMLGNSARLPSPAPPPPNPTAAARVNPSLTAKRLERAPALPDRPQKRTLLGIPTHGAEPAAPDQLPIGASTGLPTGGGTGASQTANIGSNIGMSDWDDDEPPTNIYSKKAAAEMAKAAVALGGAAPSSADVTQSPRLPEPLAATREIEHMSPEVAAATTKGHTLRVVMVVAAALVSIALVLFFILSSKLPESGSLKLIIDPKEQLQVIVDGSRILPGTISPFTIEALSPGDHNIAIRHKNMHSRIEVHIKKGELLEQRVKLEPTVSGFFLDTQPPGASVWIDDRPLEEKTPVTVNNLTAGRYVVRIAKGESFAQKTIEVEVTPGEIKKLPIKILDLKEIEVSFNTLPRGARATLINGLERKVLGITPVSTKLDTTKEYRIQFIKDGYKESVQPVTYQPGQEQIVLADVVLEKSDSGRRPPVARPRPKPAATASPPANRPSDTKTVARTGNLSVQTRPWSKVYIDGKFIKNTPLVNFSLTTGKHTITVKNPAYNIKKTYEVTIRGGRSTTLVKTLL